MMITQKLSGALALSLALVGTHTLAQEAPSLRDLQKSKKSFLQVNEEFAEAAWPNMVAPYNRTQPGLGDAFPGQECTDEDRDVFGCAYDEFTATNQMEVFHKFQEMNAAMAKEFGQNESMTAIELFGVKDDTPLILKFYEQDQEAFDIATDVLDDCGAGSLTLKRMQETGVMDRVFEVMSGQLTE